MGRGDTGMNKTPQQNSECCLGGVVSGRQTSEFDVSDHPLDSLELAEQIIALDCFSVKANQDTSFRCVRE